MMSFIEHAGEDLGGGRGPLHGRIQDVEVMFISHPAVP
jgi:hypothetical protein